MLHYFDKNQIRRESSLGSRGQISLAKAKNLACADRVDITNGIDPIEKT